MEKKMLRTLVIGTAAVVLAFSVGGCAKKKVAEEPTAKPVAVEEKIKESKAVEPLETKPMKETTNISEGRTSAPMLPVYFDFDKSNVRADQKPRLEKNAEFLTKSKTTKISIEGNCDERGTNEYNMALGQRRAQSAKKYLANLGITVDRLNTVSYGEEKPLLMGHDEYSWAQNRRDDFVIMQ
jgi:peptidoglycan-associated lipoprotein